MYTTSVSLSFLLFHIYIMLLINADSHVVFAHGGISADSFAHKLVVSLGPQ